MKTMSNYVVLKKFLNGIPELVRPEDVMDKVDLDNDWYQSLYYYNDQHIKHLKEKGSLRGVTNVKTDKLMFDFDDEDNVENAKKDTKELINRLKKHNIKESDIEIYFSGNKGFHVTVTLKNMLTPIQLGVFARKTAGDLSSFDSSVYDAAQIMRVPFTKNQKSNLYKIPLTPKQLDLPLSNIKILATNIDNVNVEEFNWSPIELSQELFQEEKIVETREVKIPSGLNLSDRPKHFKDYKWALINAIGVKPDERHEALIRIAATCKGLGYDESLTRGICLSFDDKFQALTGKPPVEDLETNILPSVFSDTWNGGAYSYKNDTWLQNYCKRINLKPEDLGGEPTMNITDAFGMFKDFATNIDELTIKTGIKPLDDKLRMTIGMSVGIVASAGTGKTSIALQILNSMSKSGEQSIFFSYDMYHALVFQKLTQKHLGVTETELFEKFKKNDVTFQNKVVSTLKDQYQNVEFCFKAGQTPDQMIETIKFTEEKTGKKVRLVVVDYNELVLTEYSDSTAASAYVAQKLREIANTLNVCVVVLLQPNKMAGNPAEEIKSYTSAKGSSAIQQSVSIMLGMHRPGYNPKRPEDDQFLSISCLKNRMGPLFALDFGWAGATGEIYEMSDEDHDLLKQIRDKKRQEEEGSDKGGWN